MAFTHEVYTGSWFGALVRYVKPLILSLTYSQWPTFTIARVTLTGNEIVEAYFNYTLVWYTLLA